VTRRPALWWLEPGQQPAWRLPELASNLHDIRLELQIGPDQVRAERLRAAEAWHVEGLSAYAYRQGLDAMFGACLPEDRPRTAQNPTTVVWLDDPSIPGAMAWP